MNIKGKINPKWTNQMQEIYRLTLKKVLKFIDLFTRTQEILREFVAFLGRSLAKGILFDKMSFREILEVFKTMKNCTDFQQRNLLLIREEFVSFDMIKYSKVRNLEEVFKDGAMQISKLLVSLHFVTKDCLKEMLEVMETCRDIILTEES